MSKPSSGRGDSGLPFHLGGLFALIVSGLIVYYPGTHGPFLFDDLTNILLDPTVAVPALETERFSDLVFPGGEFRRRPLARATFALNYYFSGQRFDVFAFKLTNVFLHLANGLLVFWLCTLLYRRHVDISHVPVRTDTQRLTRLIPLLVALIWTLHPIQLTSVLYVVQRMTSLSALFVLAGLVTFVVGRIRADNAKPYALTLMTAGVVGGGLVGSLCKEIAVLIPLFALSVELFFFDRARLTRLNRRRITLFYVVTVAVPVVVAVVGMFVWSEHILAMYSIRDFTLTERLLSESRILFLYVGLLIYPSVRHFGLFHDDVGLSAGLLDPWSTLVCIIGWLILAGLALWGVRRRSLWAFAIIWFLVGHLLESSFLALEPVHEHRNYLLSLGFVLATIHYLAGFLDRSPSTRRLIVPIVALVLLVVAFSTWTRASLWEDRLTLTTFMVRHHPQSYRSHMALAFARTQAGQDVIPIYQSYQRAAALNSKAVSPLIEMAKLVEVPLITGVTSVPEVDDDLVGLASDFSTNPRWLTAMQIFLDQEITRSLTDYPVVPTTTIALSNLVDCTQARTGVCVTLAERGLVWHRIALENPRIRSVDRTQLKYSRDALRQLLEENEERQLNDGDD